MEGLDGVPQFTEWYVCACCIVYTCTPSDHCAVPVVHTPHIYGCVYGCVHLSSRIRPQMHLAPGPHPQACSDPTSTCSRVPMPSWS